MRELIHGREVVPDLNNFKELGLGTLYALAAVFGLVGGAAAGCHYFVHSKFPKLPFLFAYMIIGAISSTVFLAVSSIFHVFVAINIHEHILYSFIAGTVSSLALFSANSTVKIMFKRLGIEVQLTVRKDREERRCEHDEHEGKGCSIEFEVEPGEGDKEELHGKD